MLSFLFARIEDQLDYAESLGTRFTTLDQQRLKSRKLDEAWVLLNAIEAFSEEGQFLDKDDLARLARLQDRASYIVHPKEKP